jgi:peptidoglycan/LPS O-acetylase OafA/YrhL
MIALVPYFTKPFPDDSGNRQSFLDGLRGLAVLMVITVHTAHTLGIPNANWFTSVAFSGERGVQLFFLVSAFTLWQTTRKRWLSEQKPWISFYIRRAFRILPLWFLMTPVFAIATHLVTATNILGTIFFFNGFLRYRETYEIVISGGWSIFIECLFYAAFPFIFIFSKTILRTMILLVSFLTISIVWLTFAEKLGVPTTGKRFIFHHPLTHFFCFPLGVFIAQWLSSEEKTPLRRLMEDRRCIACYPILVLVALPLNFYVASISLGLLFISASKPSTWFAKFCTLRLMQSLGQYAYSIYFLHFLVLRSLSYAIEETGIRSAINWSSPGWICFGACTFVTVIAISFRLGKTIFEKFERPCINYGRQMVGKTYEP